MSAEMRKNIVKLLKGRLNGFDIPNEIFNATAEDIVAEFEKPSRDKHGACVMTADASIAADEDRARRMRGEPPTSNGRGKPTLF